MSSPFPGMDPYLEDPAFWADFHHRFLDDLCDSIGGRLPDAYDARVNETINLIDLSQEELKRVYPDVAVTRRGRPSRQGGRSMTALVLEPVTIPHIYLDHPRQGRIDIVNRPDRKLVAMIEVLSPTNKIGAGFGEYLVKRREVLDQDVHLIEIDLLVGGKRPPLARPLPPGDYHVYLSRADHRPDCEVYTWTVRDPLPSIPIPLHTPDADLAIQLGEVFATTYRRGRYQRVLAYHKMPMAPLRRADAKWARAQAANRP